MVKRLLRITSDQTLHQSCLPDTRRANNGYNDRGRLVVGGAVHEGYMEARLVALDVAAALPLCPAAGLGGECLQRAGSVQEALSMAEAGDAPFR